MVYRQAWRNAEPQCSLEAWLSSVKADARWDGDPLNAFASDWEQGMPRVTEKEADRVNKLTALGNSIVPQVAYVLLTMMLEDDNRG